MTRCPSPAERARAVTEGAPAAWAEHLAACARCRAERAGAAEVIALARELTPTPPSAARREEVRTALLLRAEAPAPSTARRWGRPAGAAVLAAAAAFLIVARRPTVDAHLPHGLVRPAADARLTLAGRPGDEVVLLEHGAIRVDVVALHPGDRFRVRTRDAEVEVRGTSFSVVADHGALRDVVVTHGRVEVRVEGRPAAVLAAGQAWHAPPSIAVAPSTGAPPPAIASVASAPTAAPPRPTAAPPRPTAAPPRDRRAPAPALVDAAPVEAAPVEPPSVPTPPPPPPRDPADLAYDAAWDALRAGQFDRAAAGFAQVELLDGAGALSEDAAYWYAVALARAERPQAIGAFRSFLGAYPGSVHVGPAAVALGWLLHDGGEDAEARRRFAQASADPSPEVRAAAARGLAATAPQTP